MLNRDTNTLTKSENFCTYTSGIDLRVSHNDMEFSCQTNTVDSVLTENTVDSDSVFDNTYSTCRAPHVSQEEDCNFVYHKEQELTYMEPVLKVAPLKN